ncbi:hypothetical protein KIN20_017636 [Parelaphostrongylus tenuis]|uniref:Exonuclease domain-containing protein n=1 Tax=Parelaphostrongylus tenuis TaxID=148309 RepID=A0AAD5MI68_PARTN|nr:hypothetical protein KIN20_017636 [Parelaphostrongylus tenuis]
MTGLDHEKQTLVEIAVILTDKDLNIIAEGPDIVINQPEEVLDNMEDWSRKTFAENGLVSKIRESKIDMKQAEDMDSSRFLIVLVVVNCFTPSSPCLLASLIISEAMSLCPKFCVSTRKLVLLVCFHIYLHGMGWRLFSLVRLE